MGAVEISQSQDCALFSLYYRACYVHSVDTHNRSEVAIKRMEFEIIPLERYDEVIHHLRNNFFADEPLNLSVELCQTGEPHAELERHCLSTLKNNFSLMAIDPSTGEIAGVALNGILHRGDINCAVENLKSSDDQKFQRIFNLLYGLNESLDLFSKYNVDCLFECRILSVDSHYRGRGLAKQLLVKSLQLADENGFKIFKEDATGLYSQKIAESLGFSTALEVKYSDYIDEHGDQIFKTPAPHTTLKIMVKELGTISNNG